MTIVDANVLLDAVNDASDRHSSARQWLDGALSSTETVGFSWLVLLAFVRLSTQARIFARPLTAAAALDMVDDWLAQSPSIVLEPGPGHTERLRELLGAAGTAGALTNDAHLASLALEHDAEVITFDTDFARFAGLRWRTPQTAATTGPRRG